ncbi:MAG: CRISPR-associated endonuclease Cas3'' [Candidatus Aerophobetes bacterium]|nr:CRISPR-associated endonuclease Cas3'' [Candidatus Aerophobetes bacterium]
MNHLLSSPDEEYITHIKRAKEQFSIVYPLFESSLARVLLSNSIQDSLYKMVIFHDLGKLTKRWQERVVKREKLPAHAPVGAAYLYKILPENLREPISFAVAIHHSDRGLLGDNIEKPDVQAINNGIVDYSTNKIAWDERVSELGGEYFSEEVNNLGLVGLKKMARGLRLWSRGCGLLEQHARRMQMSLVHHILKLCDISAASEREEYKKEPDNPFGGWLMTERIKKCVEDIEVRKRVVNLENELQRCINILEKNYRPEKIILFGSLVNDKIGKWSDIDLIIVKDTKKPFLDRSKEVLLLIQPKVGMDISVYTSQEFEKLCVRKFFKEEILSKGRLIYERGN